MSHVLRLRRTDQPDNFVLLHSQQNGPAVLDLRLVGTDGENPFVAEIKHSKVQKFRSSQYQGTQQEWISILSALLLRHHAAAEVTQGLEAVASVAVDAITVSFRKNISGITQRLGVISLPLNEEEPIELFDWAGLAANSTDDLRNQVDTLQVSLSSQQDIVQQLTAQLDELVNVKKEHEDELLKKFAALLNSKKLKIRDQQRLLAHAKIDPKAAAEVQQTRFKPGRKAGISRAAKRKANESANGSETDDDEPAFETDKTGDHVTNLGEDEPSTSGRSNHDDTEDEETDDEGFAPAPMASQASRRGPSQGNKISQSGSRETAAPTAEELAAQQPPPRRELPFARKTDPEPALQPKDNPAVANSISRSQVAALTEDETEDETDDEL